MTDVDIVQRYNAIQYDGTNGQYIAETWVNYTFISDDGETLTYLDTDGYTRTVPLNDYLVKPAGQSELIWGRITPTDLATKWYTLPA